MHLIRKIIEFPVLSHLLFGKQEDLGKPAHLIHFISVPLPSLFIHACLAFFMRVFSSLSADHAILDLLVSFGLHVFLPFVIDVE